eukprot:9548863-Alexandrium_andersonii.AAC.1
MSASLVGSEMCIRDRARAPRSTVELAIQARALRPGRSFAVPCRSSPSGCLLYTSDAADDM